MVEEILEFIIRITSSVLLCQGTEVEVLESSMFASFDVKLQDCYIVIHSAKNKKVCL